MTGISRERFFEVAGLNPGNAMSTQIGANGSESALYNLDSNTSIAKRFEGTDAKIIEIPLNGSSQPKVTYREDNFTSTYQNVEEMVQALDIGRPGWQAPTQSRDVASTETVRPEVAKHAFAETILASTVVMKKTLKDGTTVEVMPQAMDLRKSVAGVRNNILGWVRNSNAERLQKKYGIDINGINPRVLTSYTEKLLNKEKLGETVFCVDSGALVELNEDLAGGLGDTGELEKVKRVLGGITQAIYTEIDKRIDDAALGEIEQIMRKQLNFVDFTGENPSEQRQNTVVMINGHTGAGKGTTLGKGHLDTMAVETGTDGIAGRGKGFEQYELVMGPYDAARYTGEFIPSKVMKLLFATEMMYARQKLDEAGRENEPVYVSGFPRDGVQAATFKDINNIKSVAMTITPETAVVRTLTRIAMKMDEGGTPRADDLNDLALKLDPDVRLWSERKKLLTDTVRVHMQMYKATLKPDQEIDPAGLGDWLSGIATQWIMFKAPAGSREGDSRYWKYDKMIKGEPEKNKKGIDQVLQDSGIATTYIECDGKSPEAVTAQVRQAIGI